MVTTTIIIMSLIASLILGIFVGFFIGIKHEQKLHEYDSCNKFS